MQGKTIFTATLITALGSAPAIAVEPIQRQTCSRSDQPQQVQQVAPRQQQAQQQRAKPQGCPVTRTIPSVVDPTPTFLL